jgi:hypothetical protein
MPVSRQHLPNVIVPGGWAIREMKYAVLRIAEPSVNRIPLDPRLPVSRIIVIGPRSEYVGTLVEPLKVREAFFQHPLLQEKRTKLVELKQDHLLRFHVLLSAKRGQIQVRSCPKTRASLRAAPQKYDLDGLQKDQ